ncbi:MAG: hypothetical protein NTV34_01700 [Proteobacteria bacterium]|nr:hypothetical protein [Pseudomonadota bacterium]
MKQKTKISELIGAVCLGFGMSAFLGSMVIAHSLIETEQRARETFAQPGRLSTLGSIYDAPLQSQKSIDEAIELYKIRIPKDVNGPRFDSSLSDRGLTFRRGAFAKINVTIGPEAFSSWAMLGSTIAHEVEVHCRQNFLAIHLMDLAGIDGTGDAEREAYAYELRNAMRFGLTPYDRDLIESTAQYYYPKGGFALRELPTVRYLISKLSRIDSIQETTRRTARSL